MIRLTRKTDYALVALSMLTEQPPGLPLSTRQMAEELGITRPLLSGVLKMLQASGLIESKRGVNGGYLMSRTPDSISVLNVIEAIEGPIAITLCCDEHGESPTEDACCDLEAACRISSQIQRLNERMTGFLAHTTLRDLLVPESRADFVLLKQT